MKFSDYPKILTNEQARGTSLYKKGVKEERERILQKIDELIDWGDNRRIDNTIFYKNSNELNDDWIDIIERLKKALECEKE